MAKVLLTTVKLGLYPKTLE